MEKNRVFGELLRAGLLCEKLRCLSGRGWVRKHRKSMLEHLNIMREIVLSMQEGKVSPKDEIIIEKLYKYVMESSSRIQSYYRFTEPVKSKLESGNYNFIDSVDENINQPIINELMLRSIEDVIQCLSKLFVDKERVQDLLGGLHNLPRVYMQEGVGTLCEKNEEGISLEDALTFSKHYYMRRLREEYGMFFDGSMSTFELKLNQKELSELSDLKEVFKDAYVAGEKVICFEQVEDILNGKEIVQFVDEQELLVKQLEESREWLHNVGCKIETDVIRKIVDYINALECTNYSEKISIPYLKNGEKKQAIIELAESDREDKVKIKLTLGDDVFEAISETYFEALIEIRKELEIRDIKLLCKGCCRNVYPSGMILSMGVGRKVYELELGKQAKMDSLVDIFEPCLREEYATNMEQEEFYKTWLESLN